MCFSHSCWSLWAKGALKCLTIGTYCTLCCRSAPAGIDLCTHCRQQFRALQHTGRDALTTTLCLGCGLEQLCPPCSLVSESLSLPLTSSGLNCITDTPSISSSNYCAACALREGQFLRHIVAPFRYAYPVDRLIKRIKYQNDRQLGRVFGTLLADAVVHRNVDALPDILVPMPLHSLRLRHRGFNQAVDIAHWAGKRLKIPVATGQVSRIVDTGSLAGLTRQERQLKILGAFRADDTLVGLNVAIVDDVLTTGSSARELARELYDSGVASVELWVLARTSSNRKRS